MLGSSFAVLVFWLFLADKVSSRSYVNLQHYRWRCRSFAYFTSTSSLKLFTRFSPSMKPNLVNLKNLLLSLYNHSATYFPYIYRYNP